MKSNMGKQIKDVGSLFLVVGVILAMAVLFIFVSPPWMFLFRNRRSLRCHPRTQSVARDGRRRGNDGLSSPKSLWRAPREM